MKNRRNYYRILHVQPDAPVEIIRASYRALMLELKKHPDLGGSSWDATLLNEAYEVLRNPERRAAYDKEWTARHLKNSASPERSPVALTSCPVCKALLERQPRPGEHCGKCESLLQSERPEEHRRRYQRALERTRRNDPVIYCSSWPGEARKAKMVDFSPQGMRFVCKEDLVPGTVLKINTPLFEATATVTNLRNTTQDGSRLYAVGVRFLAVSFLECRGAILSTSA
jgi:curved DNA-binding protein CbpA